MARQDIYTGAAPNDGTGDTLRTAAEKINETFIELYVKLGGDSDQLSSQVSLENTAVVWEGATADSYETRLIASDVGSDVTITLPNLSGTLVTSSGAQTLINKTFNNATLNAPKIISSIDDTNANQLIKFTSNANAVNEVTITNTVTGVDPIISASGNDANRSLKLEGKGSGAVIVERLAYDNLTITSSGTAPASVSYIICNSAANINVSIADGSIIGERKVITNKNTGNATIIPSSFSQLIIGNYVAFTLPQGAGTELIWDGNDWVLIGNANDITLLV